MTSLEKKQRRRRRHFWLFFDVAVLLLVFGLGYTALNASFAHRYYFSLLRDKIGWEIDAQDLSINPFLGRITIRQANVLSPSRRELFAADLIRLRISPLSLIRSQVIVSDLKISQLLLDFEKGPPKQEETAPSEPKPNLPAVRHGKFTADYIRSLVDKITQSFFLQNLAVDAAEIGPIHIVVHRASDVATKLSLERFAFHHHLTLLRKNDFGFTAKNLVIIGALVGETLQLSSEISPRRVVFRRLKLERPEGSYHLQLWARLRQQEIKAKVAVHAALPRILRKKVRVRMTLKLLPPTLEWERVLLQVGETSFEGKGSWDLTTQDYAFNLAAAAVPIEKLLAQLASPPVTDLTGEFDLQAEGNGRFPEIAVSADLVAKQLAYRLFRLPRAEVKTALRWPSLEFRTVGFDGDREILTATGTLALDRKPALLRQVTGELHQLALATHLPEAGVTGRVSGGLEWQQGEQGVTAKAQLELKEGMVKKIAIDRASVAATLHNNRLEITGLQVVSPALPELATAAPLVAVFSPDEIAWQGNPFAGVSVIGRYLPKSKLLQLQSLTYREGGRELRLSGEYRSDQTFQAKVQGEVDAVVLENYRAVFKKGEGGLVFDLAATGSVKQPTLTGSIRLKRALIGIRGLGEPLRDLNGTIRIAPDRITLEKLEGYQGDGSFQGGGTIGLAGWKPASFDLAMRGNALSFRVRGMMQLEFDAEMSLSGAMPSPLVKGTVDIISGRYYKNFRITDVVFAEEVPTEKRGELGYGIFNEWRWDLKVRNNGELRIRNNVADVYLFGDLALQGTTGRPHIGGVVTAGAGQLHYLGRNFQITEGTLEFRDPLRINPTLTLEAQEEVVGAESRGIRQFYTVKVSLEGPIDNLQTELSSVPPVDRADVISLLAFGMTQGELRERGASRSAFATGLIAGSLSSGVGAGLGKTVGLDVLRFEAAEGSEQAISGVAFGKNLSDRLSVEFYTDITPETAQRRIRSKYYLTDNIFLEGMNTIEEQRSKFELNVSLQFRIP